MIRTFHSKLNRKTLVFYLLSATVLTAYFFWVKLPLPAFCCMVFLVFVVERLIHTSYVFADDGCLYIRQGRFYKVKELALLEIREAIVVYPSALAFFEKLRCGDVGNAGRFPSFYHSVSGRRIL